MLNFLYKLSFILETDMDSYFWVLSLCQTTHGYRHRVSLLRGHPELASAQLPRVHRVIALLKRWLLGTHQGAVSRAHLDYYLDEFTFRFNRRTSRHRGKLFFRLVQQAVAIEPVPYARLVPSGGRHRQRRHKGLGSPESSG